MAVAVIVGINDYVGNWALQSAVPDALAFRAKLLERQLVGEKEIKLLTSPVVPGGGRADSQTILDTLNEIYEGGDAIDRFYFYYSGHGLMAYANAALSQLHTAIVPIDVKDLTKHGRQLIDVNELLDTFAQAGPQEQFFFVDACRDLSHEKHPDVGRLGWQGRPPGAARRQRTLFAVSPLGKAVGAREGLGVMTSHLLKAIDGEGVAIDYSEDLDRYVVTFDSIVREVQAKVAAELKGQPSYLLKYRVPEPLARGSAPKPLRLLDDVPLRPFTVHVEPEAAFATTTVEITQRRNFVDSYPPNKNHEPINLEPQQYNLKVESGWGVPEPAWLRVHLGTDREARFVIRQPGGPVEAPAPGEAIASVVAPVLMRGGPVPATGRIVAKAAEARVTIEIAGLEHPYAKYTDQEKIDQAVAAGPYAVWFRLGAETFSRKEIYVQGGEVVTVEPTVTATPLLQEALSLGKGPKTTMVSESIGNIQAGVLETLLPMIGVKALDVGNSVFHQLHGLFLPRSADNYGLRPLVLVVAVDGRWEKAPLEVLDRIRWRLARTGAGPAPLEPLPGNPEGQLRGTFAPRIPGTGFGRIGIGIVEAPARGSELELTVPGATLSIQCAARRERVTVVTVTLRSDGSAAVTQSLLRLPGHAYGDEPSSHISYGRMLREIQIGQRLYESGDELVSSWLGPRASNEEAHVIARNLLRTKWTDPVLGCMAYFACRRAVEAGRQLDPGMIESTADNLGQWFGDDLPDARIAFALAHPDQRQATLDALLEGERVPVLAEAARELATHARNHRGEQHPVVDLVRRIPPGQPWTLTRK